MNNRIMAALLAFATALIIGVAPVKAEAAETKVCTTHKEVLVPAKEPTCAENGWGEHYQCTECGTWIKLVKKKWVPMTQADKDAIWKPKTEEHVYEGAKAVDGVDRHILICTVCGTSKNADCTDADKNHICDVCKGDMIHEVEKVPGVPAKCGVEGKYGHYKCKVCGRLFRWNEDGSCGKELLPEQLVIKPLEHKKGEQKFDENASWFACQNEGCEEKLEYTEHSFTLTLDGQNHWQQCEKCTYKLAAEPHTWERKSNGDYSGTHVTTCTVCGQVNGKENPCKDNDGDCLCDFCKAPVPHAIGSLSTVDKKEPTCEASGVDLHYSCDKCKMIFKYEGGNCIPTSLEELAIKPLGHALKWNANATSHWQECTRDGCEHTTEKAQHDGFVSNGDGYHHIACKTCGANANNPKPCEDKNKDCLCDLCGGVMPHNPEVNSDAFTRIAEKKPTCTTDGNRAYYECKNCKRTFVWDGTPIDPFKGMEATGHKWEYKGYINGEHLVRCEQCEENNSIPCKDENGDCKCDLFSKEGVVCGKLMHSHKLVHVDRVEPTCEKAGTEEYLKYEGCGKMFDMNQKPISAPAEIPALGHDFGGVYEIVENGHALKCSRCNAQQEAQPHVDDNADNRCDICGAGLRLVEVPGVAPTCTDVGYETCWKSEITQQLYADADGKQPIESRKVIEKLGHAMSEWVDNGNGGHNRHCTREGCRLEEIQNHTNKVSSCVCDVCHAPILNHELIYHEAVKASCTKGGVEAYYECTCGKLYDGETKEPIAAVKTTPALGHKLSAEKVKNARGDNHYQVCTREGCDYREYADHAFQVEDPRSGNYHQMICDCGHVKTEVHYDKNGDKSCDVCGHDMSNTSEDVGKHDSENVVTGDKDTVDNSKSWWQNWWNNIFGSNAGVASSGNTRAETASEKPAAKAPSQSQAKPAPQAPQASQSSGQTEAVQQPAEKAEIQPVQKEPGFVQQFIQSFSNFFYTLFGIG